MAVMSCSVLFASVMAPHRQVLSSRRHCKAWRAATMSNGSVQKTRAQTWSPSDNKFFETFSYLPPLTDEQIIKQVEHMVLNGWTPCLEFANPDQATSGASASHIKRLKTVSPGYYDNRYWTMYKLPMFGIRDPDQVLREINECRSQFPTAFIRLVAFDDLRQVQITSFLVHRPPTPDTRSSFSSMWQQ